MLKKSAEVKSTPSIRFVSHIYTVIENKEVFFLISASSINVCESMQWMDGVPVTEQFTAKPHLHTAFHGEDC